ncbi:pyridoxal-phosphate dependent enzyme [Oceanobacillus sp. 1P07AA]|uniref:pyridoxal-phosphate dependent enzyme n=1 Tax=Oceanobacillus sp. 1P07AA TaxID=3132293 RepID=UPI0039A65C9B
MNSEKLRWCTVTTFPTPILKFQMDNLNILAKVEYLQPGCSIKNRIAHYLIKEMIEVGELTKETEYIVEATAGNTAIALAHEIKRLNLNTQVVAVVKEGLSQLKINSMKDMGIKVHFVNNKVSKDPTTNMNPQMQTVQELCEIYPNSIAVGQFNKKSNPLAHELGTGKEIVEQLANEPEALVLGAGTGGTLTGIARAIKKAGWKTKIILADPVGSVIGPVWMGENDPIPSPTVVEGIGHDIMPPLLDLSYIDQVLMVSDDETIESFNFLKSIGFPVGLSSACAWAAACKLRGQVGEVLMLFADHGSNYNI